MTFSTPDPGSRSAKHAACGSGAYSSQRGELVCAPVGVVAGVSEVVVDGRPGTRRERRGCGGGVCGRYDADCRSGA